MEATAKVVPPKVQQSAQKPRAVTRPPGSSPHFESVTRKSTLDQYIGTVKRDQPKNIHGWKCNTCGHYNNSRDRSCRDCRTFSPEYQRRLDDPNIAQNWKHVRRVHTSKEAEVTTQAVERKEPVVDRALEEARQRRLEQSTQRRFVGFEAQFRKPDLDFRAVPRRAELQKDFQAHDDESTSLGARHSRDRGIADRERPGMHRKPNIAQDPVAGATPSSKHGGNAVPGRKEPVMSTSGQSASVGWKKWTPPAAMEPSQSATPRMVQSKEPGVKIFKPIPSGSNGFSEPQDDPTSEKGPHHNQRFSAGRSETSRRQDESRSIRSKVNLNATITTTRFNGSEQEEKSNLWEKRSEPTTWKAWRPAPTKVDTKADLTDIFLQDTTRKEPKPIHDLGYEDYVFMDEATQELATQYGPTTEMKAAQQQANRDRMTRRLEALQEESKPSVNKPAPARFDPTRERRTNTLRARKHIEKLEEDDYDDEEDGARMRREQKKEKKKQKIAEKLQGPPTPIYLPEFISVANLAGALRIKIEEFISKMKELGFEETNNDHVLDAETAGLIAAEFNFEHIVEDEEEQDLLPRPPAEDKSLLPPRPPVVTIMGHVDHGKTTLLDWLRKSSVAATEHGGITQHIGAFSVPMPSGRIITFLDTPGHAAFLDMRQRGANVTDIVILVVAADDSVKPQTVEAIKHAQAAKVPMIVAVNKIDKEDADVEKVKQDLARYGVEIEDYGGDTQVVGVSGKTGQGMETLEESAVALADILDMRAETDGQAEGWVLEATTKKAGRVATVLVRRGTLRPGDIIVAGTTWARVRTLHNEAGVVVDSAGPGTPVEIDGWKDQPGAGDEVLQANDEQHARSVTAIRLEAAERTKMATDMNAVNEARRLEQERREAADKAAETATAQGVDSPPPTSTVTNNKDTTTPGFKDVPLLLKADVSGSVEAILSSVLALGNNSVRASILRSGVGPISEFDVSHAASAQGHIVAFNLVTEPHIRRAAEASGVRLLEQNIIYRLVDQVQGLLEEHLEPERTKRVLGEAEVAQVFEINVKGRTVVPVAGCRVRNGVVARNAKVVVRRGGEVVFDGEFYFFFFTLLSSSTAPWLYYILFAITPYPPTTISDYGYRFPILPQEPQTRRHRDAKGHGMRPGLRGLGRFQDRRSDTEL